MVLKKKFMYTYSMKHVILFFFVLISFNSLIKTVSAAQFLSFSPAENSIQVGEYNYYFVNDTVGSSQISIAPSFRSTSQNFAFIIPVPSKPYIQEVPTTIFKELFTAAGKPLVNKVQEPTGSVRAQTLKTQFTEPMTSWLEELGMSYSEDSVAILKKYLDRGDHVIMVSVQIPESTITDDEGYYGMVAPVSFNITSDQRYLPNFTSINSENISQKNHYFYLGNNEIYTINGANTEYYKSQGSSCEVNTTCFSQYSWATTADETTWLSYQTFDSVLSTGKGVVPLKKTDPQKIIDLTNNQNQNFLNLLNSTRILSRGRVGNDVKDLQRFLNQHLALNLVEDGNWGPKTAVAVSIFQTRYALKVDGIVGNQTRGYIAQLLLR